MSFAVPFVPGNTASWGPPEQQGVAPSASGEEAGSAEAVKSKFHDLPYAPFGRSDRIGKVADFTAYGMANNAQGRDNRRGGQYDRFSRYGRTAEENEGFTYKTDPNDEGFELVDTQKANNATQSGGKRFMAPAAKRRQQRASLRQLNARRAAANQGAAGGADKDRYNQVSTRTAFGHDVSLVTRIALVAFWQPCLYFLWFVLPLIFHDPFSLH
jgi:translation initiation factor 3 subunit D